ncbi:transposase [Nonomuraea fuscirosea]|uniref:transposase n=1 Tax=Nonomuraea fuscirosea TaxID=1291556 RepID=UPI0033D7C824
MASAPKHDLRDILYLNRPDNAWRSLPRDYPNWHTAYAYFARWQKDGSSTSSPVCCTVPCAQRLGRDPTPPRMHP